MVSILFEVSPQVIFISVTGNNHREGPTVHIFREHGTVAGNTLQAVRQDGPSMRFRFASAQVCKNA